MAGGRARRAVPEVDFETLAQADHPLMPVSRKPPPIDLFDQTTIPG
jgi:hypothetical protein